MASFTVETAANERYRKEGEILAMGMHDNVKLYKGDIVLADATTGLARPVYSGGAQGDTFMGVAMESVDNTTSGHTAAGKTIRVYRTGSFQFYKASAAIGDVGLAAFTLPDASTGATNAVGASATKCSRVGMIEEYVDATHVRVRIDVTDPLVIGIA